jgi:hypothetical protein
VIDKPFVQLQGMAEPIHVWDSNGVSGKASNSITFIVDSEDCFSVYAEKMQKMSNDIVEQHSERLVEIVCGATDSGAIDHKTLVKQKDGEDTKKITFYVSPKFTQYCTYDRDKKLKQKIDSVKMKQMPMGFYSIIVKVDHIDMVWNEQSRTLVCGTVAYVDSLCYIIPRQSEKKLFIELEDKRPDFEVAGFDALFTGAASSSSSSSSRESSDRGKKRQRVKKTTQMYKKRVLY